MSEAGRTTPLAVHRPLLALAALGIAGIVTVAFAPAASLPVAAVAVLLLAGVTAYFATRAPGEAAITPAVPPPVPGSGIARVVLETLGDPIIILDAGGRIVLANQASEAIIGPGAQRKHISAVLRTPEVLETVNRVLAGGVAEAVQFSFLVPLERYYSAYIAPTGAKTPEGSFVLVQLHDLTAIRRAEQMRADFVANASHELRTPLAAVSGFIETLRGHARNDAAARERFLDIMNVETGRMQRLIDDLLSLTRIELNEHNPPTGTADLVTVAHDAAAVLAPLAVVDDVSIAVVPHEPLLVTGDRDELIQVFQNLLHNAIKYGRAGGTVQVRFGRAPGQARRESAGQVYAAVTDEGEGIPREVIPRLTERFYRVDIRRSRERGGTGLGLAIVKHILNRHHGRLVIESTIGKGSTFTVFLPALVEGPV